MKIEVYADGSATTKDKPGGYGWVMVIDGEKVSEGSGRIENATNNDAELEAAIMGLAAVLGFVSNRVTGEWEPAAYDIEVTLVSDSQIILGWANGKNRFKQKEKIAKFNALKFLVKRLSAKTRWVEGHSGDEHNSRCDKLANWARKGIAEPKPQVKKKKKVASVNLGIAINDSLLYNMCCEAYKYAGKEADMTADRWINQFVFKLKEQMENDDYFSITVRT